MNLLELTSINFMPGGPPLRINPAVIGVLEADEETGGTVVRTMLLGKFASGDVSSLSYLVRETAEEIMEQLGALREQAAEMRLPAPSAPLPQHQPEA